MTGTMDAAAKRAEKIVQSMLPERPHHLSSAIDGPRFPYPEGFWFTGASAPLQYMTYVCDADRGVLLARPRYDICDEPDPTPVPMPVKTLGRSDVVKKKMSIKDYQNRKISTSPAEGDPVTKLELKRNDAVQPMVPKDNGRKDEARSSTENGHGRQEARLEKPSSEMNGQRNAQSKPEPKSTPLPETRKRTADPEDNRPPHKRPKPDTSTQRPVQLKPEIPRPRDRSSEGSMGKDNKNGVLHPTANGRAHSTVEHDKDRDHTASPRSTIQVNGSRPHHAENATPTARKAETVPKSSVPDLLSPLHPSFELELSEHDRQKKLPPPKQAAKPVKVDIPPPAKKNKAIVKIPELLSPTLPPIVEQELVRLKKTPSYGDLSSGASESPSGGQKPKSVVGPPETEEQVRPSRIVTFKLRKANAKRAKDLLSLPSRSLKDALKKERSISIEVTPPPPLGKKRPRVTEVLPSENPVSKRSRPSTETVLVKPVAPSTPLKHAATAMSRVASTQSQADTPGSVTRLTPGTGERPATGSDSSDHTRLRERFEEYRLLGSNLKHARDDLLKERGNHTARPEQLRIVALHFEMILAYMISFSAFNRGRMMERKWGDMTFWESLMPHMSELKNRVRDYRELMALTVQLHAVCLEEITHTYAQLEPQTAMKSLRRFQEFERARPPTWTKAMALCDDVKDPNMKTVIGPWTAVDDAVASVLAIMGRWAQRERVEWHPIVLREREKGGGHGPRAKV